MTVRRSPGREKPSVGLPRASGRSMGASGQTYASFVAPYRGDDIQSENAIVPGC